MKQFAVIGLGRFGMSVARALAEKNQQVIAIDSDEELVSDIAEFVPKAVCLDATDEKAMRAVGVNDVDVAICSIGTHIEASILTTVLLKELGVPQILCKATSTQHQKVLEKIGASKVILPEKDMGERIANSIIASSDNVIEHIGLSGDSSIIEILPPQEFIGKSLRDLEIRAKYNLNVIAIKSEPSGEKEEVAINVNPQATDTINAGDILVVFGENEKIEALKHKKD